MDHWGSNRSAPGHVLTGEVEPLGGSPSPSLPSWGRGAGARFPDVPPFRVCTRSVMTRNGPWEASARPPFPSPLMLLELEHCTRGMLEKHEGLQIGIDDGGLSGLGPERPVRGVGRAEAFSRAAKRRAREKRLTRVCPGSREELRRGGGSTQGRLGSTTLRGESTRSPATQRCPLVTRESRRADLLVQQHGQRAAHWPRSTDSSEGGGAHQPVSQVYSWDTMMTTRQPHHPQDQCRRRARTEA